MKPVMTPAITHGVFRPSTIYTLSLNIVQEEFDNPIINALIEAWIEENAGKTILVNILCIKFVLLYSISV